MINRALVGISLEGHGRIIYLPIQVYESFKELWHRGDACSRNNLDLVRCLCIKPRNKYIIKPNINSLSLPMAMLTTLRIEFPNTERRPKNSRARDRTGNLLSKQNRRNYVNQKS